MSNPQSWLTGITSISTGAASVAMSLPTAVVCVVVVIVVLTPAYKITLDFMLAWRQTSVLDAAKSHKTPKRKKDRGG